jgi:aldehyde:ferredoxin oxidoreductase
MDSNVGGFFGPFLKFSGFDAIELQGKAASDVIVYINGVDHYVEIFEAPAEAVDTHVLAEQLTDMFAEGESDRKNIGIVSAGTAADHSLIGMLNFTFYDNKRKKIRLKQAATGWYRNSLPQQEDQGAGMQDPRCQRQSQQRCGSRGHPGAGPPLQP